MVKKKLQVWYPVLFALVMIVGMFLGYRLSSSKSNKFFGNAKTNSLQEALELIRLRYVDSVNVDSLEGVAISQMMNELDPHSVYFPPVELKEANEDLAGNFDGIGVEFNVITDTVNVVFVVANGPSDKAGLQVGDKLIAANDSSLVGIHFSTEKIKELIRGKSGSKVMLRVIRNSIIKNISVTRGVIPIPSVDAAYMINETVGLIKLNKFTDNSYEEFMQAMERLQKSGMKELIFDLRGNGGGFMNEAVDMVDEFLDADKLIVYTEGTHSKKREYRCKRPGLFEKGKLTVLVDELSASASEVLAGALQDWCRAKIVGRRTFGKGLVQEQYGLSDGSAIRLTIARYYTPLGRSIQRPYEEGKKVYMDEIWERYSNGELLYADSNKINHGLAYQTICKDTLYGGGGIMPNIFVSVDTSSYHPGVKRLITKGNFNGYVYQYYIQHRQQIDAYKNSTDFANNFSVNDEMWNGLVNYAAADSADIRNISLKETTALKLRLKAVLARYKWRSPGFYQILNVSDVVVNKALSL